MNQTDLTLIEQLRITDFEVESRKELFSFNEESASLLKEIKFEVEERLDRLINDFYLEQTSVREISLIIGDAGTLEKLKNAQRKYVISLFSGVYDIEYVSNRLRIGLVHKRVGVRSNLYLAAVYSLKSLLRTMIDEIIQDIDKCNNTKNALEQLFMFDVSLVFETYISSLVSEINSSMEKSDEYAHALEQKVHERTRQLEEAVRIDALTGLINVRYLNETLIKSIRIAQRRAEPLTVVYMDVNNFKEINDTEGHQAGDHILTMVGESILKVSRQEDDCFRYGGDEFCLILPNCTEEQAQDVYLNRLSEEINKHALSKNVNLSVGIVQTGPDNYQEPEELVKTADTRMYEYKKFNKETNSLGSISVQ